MAAESELEEYPESRRESDGRWMIRLDHAVALLYYAEKVIVYRETPSALSLKVQLILSNARKAVGLLASAVDYFLSILQPWQKAIISKAQLEHMRQEAEEYEKIAARIKKVRDGAYLVGLKHVLPDWRERNPRRRHVWVASRNG